MLRAPLRQVRKSALRHFQGRPIPTPGEFPEAIVACANQLEDRFDLAGDDAFDVALSAFSEVSGRATRFKVDLQLSTPWLVFVIDEQLGMRRAIPLIDLVRLLGPREIPTHRTPPAA